MQRFPKEGFVLPEVALQKCLSADHRFLTGAEFALERAVHNEEGSPAWQVYPHTNTLVGVGLHKGKPTLLIHHGDNVLSTPYEIVRLRAQGFQRNKFQLLTEKDRQQWKQYCEQGLEEKGPKRQTWVIQGKALKRMGSGVFSLEDAFNNSTMVPMLGDLSIVQNYLIGHEVNIDPRIGVLIDKDATFSEVPLVGPLVFGDYYISNLNGYVNYCIDGCVVGVPSGAECATQKIVDSKILFPRKGSPLDLILNC